MDPFAGMSLEEKQKNMKEGLEQLINQMEPRVQTQNERKNIDKLKQLLPLYDPHPFWDTQPVPKNHNLTDVRKLNM